MPSTTPETTDKPKTTGALERYVREALTRAGFKVPDLTDEQRVRAMAAPTEKAGLRGKALVTWVMEAKNTSEQVAEAREAAKPAPKRKAAPRTSKKAEQYGQDIVDRSKLARQIEGYKAPASLKMHKAVDDTVKAELKERKLPVETSSLLSLVEVKDTKELLAFAQSKGGAPTRFRPLMAKIPKEADLRPRHIAASLYAWIEQLERPAEAEQQADQVEDAQA